VVKVPRWDLSKFSKVSTKVSFCAGISASLGALAFSVLCLYYIHLISIVEAVEISRYILGEN